jgi:hypothetical protein
VIKIIVDALGRFLVFVVKEVIISSISCWEIVKGFHSGVGSTLVVHPKPLRLG